MQYTFLGFSQERLLELGLDDRDAALLRFFIDFKDGGGMYSEEFEGDVYYWVKYDYIKQELPLIGQHFQKDAIYRRFKTMSEKGVLKHRTKKSGGTFSYYAIGDVYYTLITSSEPTQPEIPFGKRADGRRADVRSAPSGSKTVPSDPKTGRSDRRTVPSDFPTGRSDPETGTGTVAKSEGYGSKTGTKILLPKDQSIKGSEREESPPLAHFIENFPDVTLNGTQRADILATVTNEEAWKYTIWWWKFKAYRAERTDNMLDYYRTKAVPKLLQAQAAEQEAAAVPPQPQASLFAPKPPDTSADGNGHGSNGNGNSGNGGNGNGHASGLWEMVLQGLEHRISAPSFATWVRPTRLLGQHDQTVQLEVPDDVFVYWLKEHYQTVMVELLAAQLGFAPELEFVVNSAE